jgi:glycosyltransferase involved in cell wall biosynthesis
MRSKSDILLVGQTPPPYHGQAVVTGMLFDHDWGDLKVESLRMAYSDSIEAVGKFSIGKLWHLGCLILKTWWIALSRRPEVFYYLPASANTAPVIRDIIYLSAVRWCFSKTVFHYHAAGLPEYLDECILLRKLGRFVYACADVSVEICKSESSPGRSFQAHNTVIIPNGVDAISCDQTTREDDKLVVLFVGVLNEGKGLLDVIKSAEIMKKSRKNLVFHIVGSWVSQDFEREAKAMIKHAGLCDDFMFLGVLKGKHKWQAYAEADIFFFPSHYQSENFPMVLLEAMASGLPIISTNWRGIPQLVEGSDAAILCDVNAPTQYAEKLTILLDDGARRLDMGIAARAHYVSNFTRSKFTQSMHQMFSELLGR